MFNQAPTPRFDAPPPPYEKVHHPWVRLLAFLLDINLFSIPFELAIFLYNSELYINFSLSLMGLALNLLCTVTAVPLIALCLSVFGSTPGKALLGVFVVTSDNGKLPFTPAFKRTIVAYSVGLALRSQLMMVAMFFSFRYLILNKVTFWDKLSGTIVAYRRPSSVRLVFYVIFFLVLSIVKSLPLLSTILADETLSELLLGLY